MHDLFYIIEVYPQWYNLILKDTHYCISCGKDLETIKEVIYRYVRKYKIADKVYKAISGLTDKGLVAESTFARRQKDYLSGKHLPFNDIIREVVAEAIKDNRQDLPYNKVKKRVVGIVATKDHKETYTPTAEDSIKKKVTPLKVRRLTSVVHN